MQHLTESVTWSSSDPDVASVSNGSSTGGLATGLGAGTTEIRARFNDVVGTATLVVTDTILLAIDVTPINGSVAARQSFQFVATGLFSDGTTQDLSETVTWSSSDRSVARVSNAAGSEGIATGVRAGTTEIRARRGSVEGAATLSVTAAVLVAIEVTPANPSVAAGRTLQFTATGLFSDGSTQDLTERVTWSSTDRSVAKISNAGRSEGLATGVGIGSTEISARMASVAGASTLSVTIP